MRGDARVELALPVEALADRLDHEVAARKSRERMVVVRRLDVPRAVGQRERCGLELAQALDGRAHERIRGSFGRREIEQHRGHAGVDEMRGDLRAHDTGAEHGDLANDEWGGRHRDYRQIPFARAALCRTGQSRILTNAMEVGCVKAGCRPQPRVIERPHRRKTAG